MPPLKPMSELTSGTVPSTPAATEPSNDQSEHQASFRAAISGTEPIEYRARKLIAFVSKSPEAVWKNWNLAEEALDKVSTGLSKLRDNRLRYLWPSVDLTPNGEFGTLCKLTFRAQALYEAFRRADGKEFTRRCETDPVEDQAIDDDRKTRLNDFFRPWNLVDSAISASKISEEDREEFVRRRVELRGLHSEWRSGLMEQEKPVFDALDWSEERKRQIEEDEDELLWPADNNKSLLDPNSELRQVVSSSHFDPRAPVLQGPEVHKYIILF